MTITCSYNILSACKDTKYFELLTLNFELFFIAEANSSRFTIHSSLFFVPLQTKFQKPTKKNAYYKSSIPVSWGLLGYSHDIKPTFYANVEYLETNKPYFRLKFEAVSDPEDGSTSPSFSIYISPAQWKQIFELCDQQALEARCDEILAQAEEF